MELYKIREHKEKLEKALQDIVIEFQKNVRVQVNEITIDHHFMYGSGVYVPGTHQLQPFITVKLESI